MTLTAAAGRALAVAGLAGVVCAGCAAPVSEPRVGYADLNALVRLHPGYASADALRAWAAAAGQAPAEPAAAAAAPSPRTFTPPGDSLPQPEPVAGRSRRVIEQELARLQGDLERRAEQALARRRREAEREIEVRTAAGLVALQREMQAERREVLLGWRRRVFNLRLGVANLERALARPELGPAERAAAESRLADERERLGQALGEQGKEISALRQRYEEAAAHLRREAQGWVSEQVESLRSTLAADKSERLAAERERLEGALAAAERRPTLAHESPPAAAVAQPGPLGGEFARAALTLGAASREWSRAAAGDSRALAQRGRDFARFLRQDTRLTAQALAHERGWRIEWTPPERRPQGARDITTRVEEWLRGYWGA